MSEKELLQAIYHEMKELKSDVIELKSDMCEVKSDVKDLKKRMTSVELTLENETNRNIRLVAEGHLDLYRKLDDALRVENEKKMLLLRVNVMENEIRKIKEQITA